MIVLIDNENYMIRLCKDTPDIHGFHPSFPNWKNYVKFLSDAGELVVLSGKEQEDWLDENNIYYVHVEAKPKESFETFKRRMYRQIEENKEYVDSSTSFGKLVFALTKGPMEKGNVNTDNIVEIWRRNSDNKYSLRLDLPDNVSSHTYYLLVKCVKNIFMEFLGSDAAVGITVSELTSPEFNLFTSDTLPGMLYRLQLLEDLFKNDYVIVDVADDEYPEEYPEEDYESEGYTVDDDYVDGDEYEAEDCDEEPCGYEVDVEEDWDEEYPEEEAAPEEEEYSGCVNCTDYDCPDNPQHINQCNDCPYECPCDEDPADCPLDDAEEHEEDVEEDENCEIHSYEESEDKDGNSVYKVNGKEVSVDEYEAKLKEGLIDLFDALAKALTK